VIVGVHTPEFAFERVPSNVERAVKQLGLRYPIALDPDYGTWNAWGNKYWPAKYFVDRQGHLRYGHFGEGDYAESEAVIRDLLAEPGLPRPVSGSVAGETAEGVETPESYIGYKRIAHFYGGEITRDRTATYRYPATLPPNGLAYSGRWKIEGERGVAGPGARLRLAYHARSVNLVLGTSGAPRTVEVYVDGKKVRTVTVRDDDLYPLAELPGKAGDHLLELRFSPGTEAYAFTFG